MVRPTRTCARQLRRHSNATNSSAAPRVIVIRQYCQVALYQDQLSSAARPAVAKPGICAISVRASRVARVDRRQRIAERVVTGALAQAHSRRSGTEHEQPGIPVPHQPLPRCGLDDLRSCEWPSHQCADADRRSLALRASAPGARGQRAFLLQWTPPVVSEQDDLVRSIRICGEGVVCATDWAVLCRDRRRPAGRPSDRNRRSAER